ncbi:MAG: hypothetical protein J6M93_01125 [Succinivibrio sp.]|nr:hypothetical protein [Succinivibrio sp.]
MQEDGEEKKDEIKTASSMENDEQDKQPENLSDDRNEVKAGPSLAGVALQKAGFMHSSKRGSEYLPDEVRARLERFNQDLEDGTIRPDGTSAAEDREGEIGSFYGKAKRLAETSSAGTSSIRSRIRRNFKVFVIIVICFAAYYIYAAYFRDVSVMAVSSLQEQLPLKLDPHTVLTRAQLSDDEFSLTVEKDDEAFRGEDDAEIQREFDRMALSVRHLCANESISKIISSGRTLKVEVSAFAGKYRRVLSINSCKVP